MCLTVDKPAGPRNTHLVVEAYKMVMRYPTGVYCTNVMHARIGKDGWLMAKNYQRHRASYYWKGREITNRHIHIHCTPERPTEKAAVYDPERWAAAVTGSTVGQMAYCQFPCFAIDVRAFEDSRLPCSPWQQFSNYFQQAAVCPAVYIPACDLTGNRHWETTIAILRHIPKKRPRAYLCHYFPHLEAALCV